MKPLIYAGVLYAIVTGGIALANVIGGAAWAATGLLYLLVILAFELHVARSRISNRQCAVLNTILATTFSLLVFVDVSMLHRGILKDELVAAKLLFVIVWVGVPTGVLGCLGCCAAKFILRAKASSEIGEYRQ
jgi:hypothetical protein